jgi:predicted aspartyl protease
MRLPFLMLAGAGALMAGPALAASPCQIEGLGELPVATNGAYATIEAQVDGRPVRLIVDTGTSGTMLFREGALQLRLTAEPLPGVEFAGLGGEDDAAMAKVRELRLGDLIARDTDLVVTGRAVGGAEGVLGARLLLQADVEFDFPEGKIRLVEPQNCEADQVLFWKTAYSVAPTVGPVDQRIVVAVSLNGAPVRAELDTAAPTSAVSLAAAARAGAGGERAQSFVAVFSTFAFGDETIRNARLRVVDRLAADNEARRAFQSETPPPEAPDMILGADFFRSHKVYVARDQGKVYISYMGGPVFQTTLAAGPGDPNRALAAR